MLSDWIETTIGEQVTLQRGFDITKAEQRPGIVPVVSSSGISSYHDTIAVKGPGVVLGRKGVVGSVYFLNVNYWPHDTTLWIKNYHDNDQKFVYYFFKNFSPRLSRLDVGSANPTLNRNHVHPIRVLWPPIPEQISISHILGTLDDKIDLNRQMNSTLEQIVQALFKRWFIDFEFPDENGNPYKSSGGRMVVSELGEIPEGWNIGTIKDLVNHFKETVAPQEETNKLFHHYSIPAYDSGKVPEKEFGSQIKSNKFKVISNCILVSKLNPENPRIWNVGHVDESLSVCSTELQVFVSKYENWKSFVYCLFKSNKVRGDMTAKMTGTSNSHQRINPHDILNIQVVLPNKEITLRFVNSVNLILEKIQYSLHEAENLSQIRDSLLPKLMSGKIRVQV